MSYLGTPTHDQLRVFLAIVDSGSFAGAARQLARATSVVSYSIAKLEEQLGVTLFDRETTRKPQLTHAGRMVLLEARTVARGIDGLRAKVKALRQGTEAEVSLVLDVMLPEHRVIDAINVFRKEFPTVSLHLRTEALGAAMQCLLDGVATIGVVGPPDAAIDGIERVEIPSVLLVPVAAPTHPLALAAENAPGAGREHAQVVLTDRSSRTHGQDLGVLGTQTWRVTDLASKYMLIRNGIGWGNMPEPLVRDDLRSGRLVRLDLPDCQGGPYRLFAAYRTDTPPGPAASQLISRFKCQTGE